MFPDRRSPTFWSQKVSLFEIWLYLQSPTFQWSLPRIMWIISIYVLQSQDIPYASPHSSMKFIPANHCPTFSIFQRTTKKGSCKVAIITIDFFGEKTFPHGRMAYKLFTIKYYTFFFGYHHHWKFLTGLLCLQCKRKITLGQSYLVRKDFTQDHCRKRLNSTLLKHKWESF